MMIIGCDFHTRYQQIAMADNETGELLLERRLEHESGGVEQAVIEQRGLGKNGGMLANKINSIAKTNPIYKQAVEFGKILLGISKPGGV